MADDDFATVQDLAEKAPEWHAFASRMACDEISVRFETPLGIYDLSPLPAQPMPSVITLNGWPGVPDAIMVNGVRFIPAGGR